MPSPVSGGCRTTRSRAVRVRRPQHDGGGVEGGAEHGAADVAALPGAAAAVGDVKFSTDPELVAKVIDVVGLYLAPPENAIVLCMDEKSQIQALDRTQKMLPMQPGFPE